MEYLHTFAFAVAFGGLIVRSLVTRVLSKPGCESPGFDLISYEEVWFRS